ncbi:hypothetical protein MNB_SV-15-941 [hydrothermal vent metagenome]|uniref:Methyltransferase domain-containing protein n=1 Tax=hydrothermal vent metagenome TaxID=652676 RepID=A0A1W1EKI8_9ZZZZ
MGKKKGNTILVIKRFEDESTISIIEFIQNNLKSIASREIISFEVLKEEYGGRGFKHWVDLANILKSKMLMPKDIGQKYILIRFQKLDLGNSFHHTKTSQEKYGVNSKFFKIDKINEASFIYYYLQSLKNVDIKSRKRVINLGINRADEFEVIREIVPINKLKNIEFVGVDYSKSAIEYAQNRFKEPNFKFFQDDINDLDYDKLGKFDMLITIGTLQSVNSNFKLLFMKLFKTLLTHNASLILGFPNSRWIDGELIYGAKAPNYSYSELSILYKDIYFCKKYLQQHKYRVTITGKDYIFLTATRIGL